MEFAKEHECAKDCENITKNKLIPGLNGGGGGENYF